MRKLYQNEPVANKREIFFRMVSDTDGVTGATGLTIAAQICKADESSFAAIVGGESDPITEIGNGIYKCQLDEADLDTVGEAVLRFSATDALDCFVSLLIQSQVDSTGTETITPEKALEAILAAVGGKTIVSTVDSDTKRVQFLGRDGTTTVLQVDVSTATAGSREASTVS